MESRGNRRTEGHHQSGRPDIRREAKLMVRKVMERQTGLNMKRKLNKNLPWLRLAMLGFLLAFASNFGWSTNRGPDSGSYTATDSTVYSFVDISGAAGGASVLAGTDDGTAVLNLPFPFQFYGQTYTMACVGSNGALYFITSAAACGGFNDFA